MADEIKFDWDEANLSHIARHNVSREEAEQAVLNDPVDYDFQDAGNEPRWVVGGMTNGGRLLTVVYAERGPKLRVVTAWDADEEERAAYFERKGY